MKQVIYDLYPIVNGCSTECIFSGTVDSCKEFAHHQRQFDSSFDYILLPYMY